jgi:hypothetical protein
MNRLGLDDAAVIEASCAEPDRFASLFDRFLAATPGLTVEAHVRDVSGRPGIGVVWHFYGSKAMNIFDPRSFAYLGMTTWGEQGQLGGDALVQTAIVDRAGEIP